jgi:hypothetical protein
MVLMTGAAKVTMPTRRKAEKAAWTSVLLASMRTPNGAKRPSMLAVIIPRGEQQQKRHSFRCEQSCCSPSSASGAAAEAHWLHLPGVCSVPEELHAAGAPSTLSKRTSEIRTDCSATSRRPTVKLTNDSNRQNGYRAHVRRRAKEMIPSEWSANSAQCPVGARFPEAGTADHRDSHTECEC